MNVLMAIGERDFDPTEVAVPWKVLSNAGVQVHFGTTGGGWGKQEDPLIQKRVDLYKSTANSILRTNLKAVERIAKELRRRGRLSGADVQHIIETQKYQAA